MGITETEITSGMPPVVAIDADTNLLWNADDPIVGTGAIHENPRLHADLRPRAGSPAVDAGIDIPWLTADIEGAPRVPGAYDLGAFEWLAEYLYVPLIARQHP